MGIVYIATNRENGKQYIGYTSRTLSQRIREHKSHTKNSIFHSALRKYGIEMFQFEKLYESDDLFLLQDKEIEYIKKYNTITPQGYNIKAGGGGGGKVKDVEMLHRMSVYGKAGVNAQKERGILERTHALLRTDKYREMARRKTIELSKDPEYIKKCSNAARKAWDKRKKSIEYIKIMKQKEGKRELKRINKENKRLLKEELRIKRIAEIESIPKRKELRDSIIRGISEHKRIYCQNNNKIYKSTYEASDDLAIPRPMIIRVCQNKRSHTHGYVFTYI